MKIHFVCTGNTYRSRMAEAYLRSKQIPSLDVSSSGTHAYTNENGPVSWLSAWVLRRRSLVEFLSPHWQQMNEALLHEMDKIIFMEENHYLFCKKEFNFAGDNYEIWNIADIDISKSPVDDTDLSIDAQRMKFGLKTFSEIEKKVNEFIFREELQPEHSSHY